MTLFNIPHAFPFFAISFLAFSSSVVAETLPKALATAEIAASDGTAFQIVEGLTTEIGPRQGGTEAEQRARNWAVAKLKSLRFANVREEHFDMPTWVRGEESAWVVSPYQMPLAITALGNSGSTGAKPLEGEIVYFETYDALVAADPAVLKGKIAFVDHQMKRTQDGTRYFDLHHTPDDTLDKVDPEQLRQNVVAWATVLDLVANYEGELKS